MVNALSVDVEEYYHGMEFEAAARNGACAALPSRVEWSVQRVLAILAARSVRATFFTVGTVALAHPIMMRKIAGEGHEIAAHGYSHALVSRQTPEEFRQDVRRCRETLSDIVGEDVVGYRAPNYSITPAQSWAYRILAEEGFRYESSVYPIVHDRYGMPDAPRFPYVVFEDGDTRLVEFPIGTARVGGVNLPIGGGGYFRLFPVSWIRAGIRRVNLREGRSTMFYFHPWELDPDQPRPPMPWHHRFRHYVNLDRFAAKLDALVASVPFAPVRQVLELEAR